uniref:Uncharacterized protein n=1 Tax=Strigamia maritima TaxID=126957 RepID=T1JHY3_STRMM
MSFFRSLCSVTPAGIGGFLYESFTNQWQRNLLTVKAYSDESNSPNCPNIEDYLPDDENQPIEPVYQLNDSWEEEELEGENSIEDAINQWNFEHSDDEDQSDQSDHEFNNNDDNLENGNIWGNIVVDENAFNEFLNHAQNGQNEEIIADLHVLPEHDEYHDVSQNLAENDEFGDDENNIFLLEGAEFENAVNKAFVAEGNDQCARQNDGGNGDNIWVDRVHQEVSAECPQVCGPVSDDYDVDERSYLGYGNCLVHYNCNSKTIYWTVENLTDENVGESEHRHCEFLRIQPGVTECDESQACGNDNRHDIAFLPQAADNGNAAGSQQNCLLMLQKAAGQFHKGYSDFPDIIDFAFNYSNFPENMTVVVVVIAGIPPYGMSSTNIIDFYWHDAPMK